MLVQTNLSFDSGFNVLKMEIQVCKQQIMNYRKAYVSLYRVIALNTWIVFIFFILGLWEVNTFELLQEVQKLKLAQSEKALIYFKYHPVHGSSLEKDVNYDKIRKRLKRDSRVSCSWIWYTLNLPFFVLLLWSMLFIGLQIWAWVRFFVKFIGSSCTYQLSSLKFKLVCWICSKT